MAKSKQFEREQKRRRELLTLRPARVVFMTALPLLAYSLLSMALQFFDVLTVSKIDQNMVSTVSFVGDIQNIVDVLFMSMSVGLGIRISQAFGAGDTEAIKRDISTIFFFVILVSISFISFCIPFSNSILKFCGIPTEILDMGSKYFSFSILTSFISSINVIYFASLKARGRTKVVSLCNMLLLILKLGNNLLVMRTINNGTLSKELAVVLLPMATFGSQLAVWFIAMYGLLRKDSIYRVSTKYVNYNKEFFLPFFKLTLPIILIKVINAFSKIICNSQYAAYGSAGLAAFTCCNKICSLITSPLNAFQDAQTTVIAANLGNHDYERVKKTMSDSLWLTLGFVSILFTAVSLGSENLISYFSNGDVTLSDNIRNLFRIERLDSLFMALDCVCSAYLFATKKTKFKTVSSLLQKIVLRIPLLYLLINVYGLGIEAIAIAILTSNIVTSIFTAITYLFVRRDYESKLQKNVSAYNKLIDAIRALGRLDAFDEKGNTLGIEIPTDILDIMKERYGVEIETAKLEEEYKYALIEARIDELEKQENAYA